jgi:hypothetical protein
MLIDNNIQILLCYGIYFFISYLTSDLNSDNQTSQIAFKSELCLSFWTKVGK